MYFRARDIRECSGGSFLCCTLCAVLLAVIAHTACAGVSEELDLGEGQGGKPVSSVSGQPEIILGELDLGTGDDLISKGGGGGSRGGRGPGIKPGDIGKIIGIGLEIIRHLPPPPGPRIGPLKPPIDVADPDDVDFGEIPDDLFEDDVERVIPPPEEQEIEWYPEPPPEKRKSTNNLLEESPGTQQTDTIPPNLVAGPPGTAVLPDDSPGSDTGVPPYPWFDDKGNRVLWTDEQFEANLEFYEKHPELVPSSPGNPWSRGLRVTESPVEPSSPTPPAEPSEDQSGSWSDWLDGPTTYVKTAVDSAVRTVRNTIENTAEQIESDVGTDVALNGGEEVLRDADRASAQDAAARQQRIQTLRDSIQRFRRMRDSTSNLNAKQQYQRYIDARNQQLRDLGVQP